MIELVAAVVISSGISVVICLSLFHNRGSKVEYAKSKEVELLEAVGGLTEKIAAGIGEGIGKALGIAGVQEGGAVDTVALMKQISEETQAEIDGIEPIDGLLDIEFDPTFIDPVSQPGGPGWMNPS